MTSFPPCCTARRARGLAGPVLIFGFLLAGCQVPNPAWSGAAPDDALDAAADGEEPGTGGGTPPPDARPADDVLEATPDAALMPLDATVDRMTITPVPGCPADDPSLRLCLRFEGDTADDSQYRHANNQATELVFVDGPGGRALRIGPQSVLSYPEHPAFTVTKLTLEAWLYVTSRPEGESISVVLDNDRQYALGIASDGKAFCDIRGSKAFSIDPVPLNAWTAIACTFENKSVSVVVEGKLAGGRNLGFDLVEDGSDGVFVGSNGPEPIEKLDGVVDNLRIWGRVLSFTELCQHAINCR